ncbi:hypothetical protein C2I18_02125 [Paenibacillus sp. PK3_47]|uniref:DUF2953 domain-containing protein n=1 Tax=Paenibacillus sp. PK3_47 TaxID=2072642 RepID=UPI00201E1AD3|nr:DUF2953 domain-containing protein [Paenibacillus sp. PK3_47]UQZ32455.1 hypothetical protein C2I18_02125 [Paenibacillus sp. PK3_47]
MKLWLAILLALLLFLIILVLSSSIHFHFRVRRTGKNDRVEFDLKALFGLVKFHYELPEMVYEGIERGIRVKLEESGMAPFKMNNDKVNHVDKQTLTNLTTDIKLAIRATGGLKKWLKGLMSNVKILKLDWSTDFSLGDAAYTATAAGALWGMKWILVGWGSQFVRLQHTPRLFVAPVFKDDLCFSTVLVCNGKLSLAYVLYSGLVLLRRIISVKGGLALWRKLLSRKQRESSGEGGE